MCLVTSVSTQKETLKGYITLHGAHACSLFQFKLACKVPEGGSVQNRSDYICPAGSQLGLKLGPELGLGLRKG